MVFWFLFPRCTAVGTTCSRDASVVNQSEWRAETQGKPVLRSPAAGFSSSWLPPNCNAAFRSSKEKRENQFPDRELAAGNEWIMISFWYLPNTKWWWWWWWRICSVWQSFSLLNAAQCNQRGQQEAWPTVKAALIGWNLKHGAAGPERQTCPIQSDLRRRGPRWTRVIKQQLSVLIGPLIHTENFTWNQRKKLFFVFSFALVCGSLFWDLTLARNKKRGRSFVFPSSIFGFVSLSSYHDLINV